MAGVTLKSFARPSGPEDITPEWLTAVFQSSGWSDDSNVTSVVVRRLGVEKGATGTLARLTLTYEGAAHGLPTRLIVKFPALPGKTRELAGRFRLYEREANFYRDLSNRVALPTPRLYGCGQDAMGDPILLFEDMAPAQEGSLLDGCSLDQLETLVRPLADFHATWWASPELDRCDWLPAPDQPGTLDYADQISKRAWNVFRNKHGDKFPRPIHAIGEALQSDRTVLHRLAAPPRTLVHGDLRCNNLMFTDSDQRDLVAVIDWQTVSKARGPFDIASLFVNNLQPEDRRVAEAKLLPQYHQLLQRAGVRGYDYAACWVDYRLAVINQFSQVIVLSALLDILTLMGEELSAATGTRLMVALLDLDTAGLLPESDRHRWGTLLKRAAARLSLTHG